MHLSAVDKAILRSLRAGPAWARSFQYVKPALERLIAEGLVQRVAPPGQRARNMVALVENQTDAA